MVLKNYRDVKVLEIFDKVWEHCVMGHMHRCTNEISCIQAVEFHINPVIRTKLHNDIRPYWHRQKSGHVAVPVFYERYRKSRTYASDVLHGGWWLFVRGETFHIMSGCELPAKQVCYRLLHGPDQSQIKELQTTRVYVGRKVFWRFMESTCTLWPCFFKEGVLYELFIEVLNESVRLSMQNYWGS